MNSSSRNGAKVRLLAVHTTEGIMRVGALRDFFNNPNASGSSHAASDETGSLWGPEQGYVPYERAAWTLRNGNPISDNIEQCGWARWTRAEWLARPALLEATARWLAERSAARGIPLVKIGAAEIKAGQSGVIGHWDWTQTGDGSHTDPGPGYPWAVVIDRANEIASGDDMPSLDDIFDHPIPREGTDPATGKPLTGTTTLRGTLAYLDANLTAIPTKVMTYKVDRAGAEPGKTDLANTIAYLDANLGVLGSKVASGDPEELAAAIKSALGDELAADVAARLTVSAKPA